MPIHSRHLPMKNTDGQPTRTPAPPHKPPQPPPPQPPPPPHILPPPHPRKVMSHPHPPTPPPTPQVITGTARAETQPEELSRRSRRWELLELLKSWPRPVAFEKKSGRLPNTHRYGTETGPKRAIDSTTRMDSWNLRNVMVVSNWTQSMPDRLVDAKSQYSNQGSSIGATWILSTGYRKAYNEP